MERIKLFLFSILCLIFISMPVYTQDNITSLVTPQNVDFRICTKIYNMSENKLFYMAIASANANNFTVNEIQSKTGYILFTAAGKQYLASVVKINSKDSMLKITPVNNNYYFAPGIVLNFFKYIDINLSTNITKI